MGVSTPPLSVYSTTTAHTAPRNARIADGASPVEATIFSNHAAGVVVGKRGTATVSPAELLATFDTHA